MMCLKIPQKILKVIDKKMRKLFWNGARDHDKIPLFDWEQICRGKIEGGVGLKNLQITNKAMGEKLVWSIYSNMNHLRVRIMKAKYLDSQENH